MPRNISRILPLKRSALALTALALAFAGGCASAPKEEPAPKSAVFYPPPPDAPRLQFLTSFSDATHLVTTKSSFAEFVVGTEQEQEAPGNLHAPYGIATYNGKLYICDIPLRCVHVYDLVNKGYTRLGRPDTFFGPVNINIDADGTKYVCDTQKSLVFVFDANDHHIATFGDPNRCAPIDLVVVGDELYVCNIKKCNIEVWSKSSGELLRSFSSKGLEPDQLRSPTNIAVGPDGNLYVTDTELCSVKVFNPEGKLTQLIGEPGDRPGYFARPKGIAIDPDGVMYVADAQWEIIQLFTTEGKTLLFFGGTAAGPEGMGLPAGVTLDTSCLPAFEKYLAPGFKPKYLLIVANQFGNNKIGIYAFGEMKSP
jgi:sugar lactone lactonase YvrE